MSDIDKMIDLLISEAQNDNRTVFEKLSNDNGNVLCIKDALKSEITALNEQIVRLKREFDIVLEDNQRLRIELKKKVGGR
jgi:hypothetical protein